MRLCTRCDKQPRQGASVRCRACNEQGAKEASEASRLPWWNATPYRLANVEPYLTEVQRLCATEPDPALVLPARLVRVNLPPLKENP